MITRTEMSGRSSRPGWLACAVIGSALAISSSGTGYRVQILGPDDASSAAPLATDRVDGWGLALTADGPWCVANRSGERGTLFDGGGTPLTPALRIAGRPTGVAVNEGGEFEISDGAESGPAVFLFATDDGRIFGWSPRVPPPPPSREAFVAVEHSSSGSVYTGLTTAKTPWGERLYAADFRRARIDVFDARFRTVALPGAFVDPGLPRGFSPFGIQCLADRIVVAYATPNGTATDGVSGEGMGVVDAFDYEGRLVARVATRGPLNAPWGLAMSPDGFGGNGPRLLVANSGDGTIDAFSAAEGGRKFVLDGELRGADGTPIRIPGLRGIAFGNGVRAGAANALYFVSSASSESGGAFGRIVAP